MTYPLYLCSARRCWCACGESRLKRDRDGKRRQKYSIYSGTWLIYRHKWCFFIWKKKHFEDIVATKCVYVMHTVHDGISEPYGNVDFPTNTELSKQKQLRNRRESEKKTREMNSLIWKYIPFLLLFFAFAYDGLFFPLLFYTSYAYGRNACASIFRLKVNLSTLINVWRCCKHKYECVCAP